MKAKMKAERATRRTMSFRPSPEMRRKLEQAVEKSGRSMCQEIELRLELGHAPAGGEEFKAGWRQALFEEALQSIAANTCCDRCQEAALVAKRALDRELQRARRLPYLAS